MLPCGRDSKRDGSGRCFMLGAQTRTSARANLAAWYQRDRSCRRATFAAWSCRQGAESNRISHWSVVASCLVGCAQGSLWWRRRALFEDRGRPGDLYASTVPSSTSAGAGHTAALRPSGVRTDAVVASCLAGCAPRQQWRRSPGVARDRGVRGMLYASGCAGLPKRGACRRPGSIRSPDWSVVASASLAAPKTAFAANLHILQRRIAGGRRRPDTSVYLDGGPGRPQTLAREWWTSRVPAGSRWWARRELPVGCAQGSSGAQSGRRQRPGASVAR
jgi:hypothetical protein